MVMDRLRVDEVRQGSPWTMMYADDMVICNERVEGESIEAEVCLGKEGNEGQPQ